MAADTFGIKDYGTLLLGAVMLCGGIYVAVSDKPTSSLSDENKRLAKNGAGFIAFTGGLVLAGTLVFGEILYKSNHHAAGA